jgi:putative phosphoesterase
MLRGGLIADTHNYLDPQVFEYFKECDEIWHAGDFCTIEIANQLKKIAPVIGVYGNIDGQDIRLDYPCHQRFTKEGVDVWITHIGGNPGRYAIPCKVEMETNPPDIFICGHSHILKIARDTKHTKTIYINPGAAGRQGFHFERTIVRFTLHQGKIDNVEVVNLGPRTDFEEE